MGIDARILIRVKGEKPTEDQLQFWSWHICQSIGARHFWINDGLPRPEYVPAYAKWREAFDNHPDYAAFVNMQGGDERRGLHEKILADIGKAPEERRRAIDFSCISYADNERVGDGGKLYEPGKIFFQDGDDIVAGEDEWLLRVSVWSRYYGKDYERGDLLTLCAIAEWCEANIPNCEVWYGGDSSGVCAEPWPATARYELRRHLYGGSGRDYFSRLGDMLTNGEKKRPKPCSLCVKDGQFSEFGWGHNWLAVTCAGCGKSFETRDDGTTWTVRKEED